MLVIRVMEMRNRAFHQRASTTSHESSLSSLQDLSHELLLFEMYMNAVLIGKASSWIACQHQLDETCLRNAARGLISFSMLRIL